LGEARCGSACCAGYVLATLLAGRLCAHHCLKMSLSEIMSWHLRIVGRADYEDGSTLFVVPVGDNAHGKTTMLKALVSQGGIPQFDRLRKAPRRLLSPWGREIDAYAFGRSYQEVEKGSYGSVVDALDGSDPNWRERELIILPTHVDDSEDDVDEMIEAAHSAGFVGGSGASDCQSPP
jgi:hypothetical protein